MFDPERPDPLNYMNYDALFDERFTLMTISKDLYLAILAMDAYNRGYGVGIGGLSGIGSKLGSATILTDSETQAVTKSSCRRRRLLRRGLHDGYRRR